MNILARDLAVFVTTCCLLYIGMLLERDARQSSRHSVVTIVIATAIACAAIYLVTAIPLR